MAAKEPDWGSEIQSFKLVEKIDADDFSNAETVAGNQASAGSNHKELAVVIRNRRRIKNNWA